MPPAFRQAATRARAESCLADHRAVATGRTIVLEAAYRGLVGPERVGSDEVLEAGGDKVLAAHIGGGAFGVAADRLFGGAW